ncbi:hypothetical protein BC937DRAFT_94333 [Endogone sp. FLAS-F59071]|nr:hypothetical protein BC937DRAFT_94333 [Endogone sp. FLAS-F59071]|eukprot:RUS20812.1 hypothetical protein BC937DRAFT_94333 [Endogone sp. FLAS-F59071]
MLRSLLRTAIHHHFRRHPPIPLTLMGISTDRNSAPDVPDIENLPQTDGGPTRKEEEQEQEQEQEEEEEEGKTKEAAAEPAWAAAHRKALKVGF